jgi:hypothetical protein
MLAISLSATLLGTQVSSIAFAQDAPPPVVVVPPIWTPGMTDSSGQLVPPPLFNQDGSPFQQRSTSWFLGMRDASGTEIPPPLYNVDGTPYIEGVSPRPQIPIYSGGDVATGSQTIETVLAQTIDWYPGMLDRSGNEIPAPLFNQDGSAYIEGVSPRPKIPVYAEVAEPKMPIALAPISDQVLVKKVNTEIRSTDVTLRKASDAYVLAFEDNVSAVDSSLYLSAVNKRSKKATKIAISINSLGQAVAVTKVDLSKFNVFIKRGKSTLNKVKIGEPAQ